ncbi:putative manganese-dependent inorganic diphosphatase [Coriobacteriales bacterium OH1046]|nr:putative manganese-dependent inorganic diphosphatase [Coriobacteriales bacterium OH1046]
MTQPIRKINIIGHLHPDTDSICSAIAYAYLKNQMNDGIFYQARRAGNLNRETAFVLRRFGFEEPRLITTVTPQLKDADIQYSVGIGQETSLYAAWTLMRELGVDTLCITNDSSELLGLIAVKDIANANMDIFDTDILARSRTSYYNILDTLSGTMVTGDPAGTVEEGKVLVGTTPDVLDTKLEPGDIVLVTNLEATQRFAIEHGAKCLIVCCSVDISDEIVGLAEEHGCAIIATPHDTYETAQLICMSAPVRARMLPAEKILSFSRDTAVEDAQKIMAKTRHRFYPVLDDRGHFIGTVTSINLLEPMKKHVILVDHNERSQAVDGLDEAEIVEIIDHHRIGSVETSGPVMFRNMPVGCTCTILYDIFLERGVEIPAAIAGLMLSAILSDTLAFRSPTCTEKDIRAGTALAAIADVGIDAYADEMFEAGADLTGRSAEEVFGQDFKVFSRGHVRFGVGQGSYLTDRSRLAAEELIAPYLPEAAVHEELPLLFYLFTDIKTKTSDLLFHGSDGDEIVERAFGVEAEDGKAVLPGVVSRKKQVVPPIMATIQGLIKEREE